MPEFKKELETYNKNKERLLADKLEGQYVLIHDEDILGIFASADDAYKEGLEKLGNAPMFIKRIQKDEPPDAAPALMFGLIHAHIQ